jgi:hypothetical protein
VRCYIKAAERSEVAKENAQMSARRTEAQLQHIDKVVKHPGRIRTDEDALLFMKAIENQPRVREICGGITRQAVLSWTRIPVQYCPALEKAFGIPRAVMRPDIYG